MTVEGMGNIYNIPAVNKKEETDINKKKKQNRESNKNKRKEEEQNKSF
jgi:hypothetical protein